MSELPEIESKKSRRSWLVLWGIIVLLLGWIGFNVFQDDPPPDDAWLLPTFAPGGGEKNPLAIFIGALRIDPLGDIYRLPQKVMRREKGQEPAMRGFVEKHVAVSEALDALMQSDPADWRWPGVAEDLSSRSRFENFFDIQGVASPLERMKVDLLARAGNGREAADEAMKTILYGTRLCAVQGTVFHWLVSITAVLVGQSALETALTTPDVDEGTLLKTQRFLIPLEPKIEDFSHVLRVEYLSSKNTFATLGPTVMAASLGDVNAEWVYSLLVRKNRTMTAYLDLQRPVTEAATRGWPDFLRAERHQSEILQEWNAHRFRMLINPNAGGYRLLGMMLSTADRVGDYAAISVTKHRLILIEIALRRYELAEHKLPEKLEALVPKYLPALPLDPYDNAAIRWNFATQTIYSIGADLKDDGGNISNPPNKSRDKDIGMRYWWKRPDARR